MSDKRSDADLMSTSGKQPAGEVSLGESHRSRTAAHSASLLASTGQSARLRVAGRLFLGGIMVAVLARLPFLESAPLQIGIATAGCLVALGGALNALFRIRCPSCSLRWAWWSMKFQHYSRWLFWLQEFDACPKCGYSGAATRHEQTNRSLDHARAR